MSSTLGKRRHDDPPDPTDGDHVDDTIPVTDFDIYDDAVNDEGETVEVTTYDPDDYAAVLMRFEINKLTETGNPIRGVTQTHEDRLSQCITYHNYRPTQSGYITACVRQLDNPNLTVQSTNSWRRMAVFRMSKSSSSSTEVIGYEH